ncbi:hypothetical protein H257_15599 [Aphanomyces astaci]|uniref:Uncharacterized protein n=1 Tax=Aphanomyces astaci TaxID=112090 RepID=W4FNC7_APHAT|nr:hypothetical protein H257_15599 [Aphanomyces astaci]ETV68436.1 hypothetical protein H257_15599 [Aphanomyces astaci]|eukprot:XP_009842062.1 hypothetical protein H257_15599 [Aphanomyces astaci]
MCHTAQVSVRSTPAAIEAMAARASLHAHDQGKDTIPCAMVVQCRNHSTTDDVAVNRFRPCEYMPVVHPVNFLTNLQLHDMDYSVMLVDCAHGFHATFPHVAILSKQLPHPFGTIYMSYVDIPLRVSSPTSRQDDILHQWSHEYYIATIAVVLVSLMYLTSSWLRRRQAPAASGPRAAVTSCSCILCHLSTWTASPSHPINDEDAPELSLLPSISNAKRDEPRVGAGTPATNLNTPPRHVIAADSSSTSLSTPMPSSQPSDSRRPVVALDDDVIAITPLQQPSLDHPTNLMLLARDIGLIVDDSSTLVTYDVEGSDVPTVAPLLPEEDEVSWREFFDKHIYAKNYNDGGGDTSALDDKSSTQRKAQKLTLATTATRCSDHDDEHGLSDLW